MRPRLELPAEGAGCVVVASVSGGKDSTALILALRDAEIPARYVFADTGWEAPETYGYLDTLRDRLGIAIDVVHPARDMVASIRHRAGFPARMQRWCTRELKLIPLRRYHDAIEAAGTDTVSAMGVRAQESQARAKMLEWEDEPAGDRGWGGFLWRPLLAWELGDVIAIHHRHALPLNPLYLAGFSRVGCYPCIFSQKEEIRTLAARSPDRIAEIAALELECEALRVERNAETPGRHAHAVASFFQTRETGVKSMRIGEVVQWARTSKGGRQFPLLQPPPSGGCMKWGLCEPPEPEPDPRGTP